MPGSLKRLAGSTLPFWLLAAAALALFAVCAPWRLPASALRGDEGTYLAMASSLAVFSAGRKVWKTSISCFTKSRGTREKTSSQCRSGINGKRCS